MMKKILLLSLPLLLCASEPSLEQKVNQLQKELRTLQQQQLQTNSYIDEEMEIVEKVEIKSILDKVNFSPELLVRFDKFDYKNGEIAGENTKIYNNANPALNGLQRRDEYSKHFDLASSLRFRLNMNAHFQNVKFYGRLFYMNSSQSNQRLCILSRDIKSVTAGSAFDIDRAYFDYKLSSFLDYPFTFSFGLLPTSGGTPMHYAQNKKRNALFPALVFDMNTYGLIATQQLNKTSYLRFVLAKAYTLRPNFYPYQCNRENIDNANIIGLYADTSAKVFGQALISFGANVLNQLKAHPYLGPDVSASNAHNLGTLITYGAGIDIEKFAQTRSTLFFHTALSNPHPNGHTDDYKIVAPLNQGLTAGGYTGFTEADYASGTMLEHSGYALYFGIQYPWNEAINFGAEYNYGSKYWFGATQGAEDIFNKLATRGSCYEVYGNWQLQHYLTLKFSYLNLHENYTGSGWHFGKPAAKDATQNIASLSLEAKF